VKHLEKNDFVNSGSSQSCQAIQKLWWKMIDSKKYIDPPPPLSH